MFSEKSTLMILICSLLACSFNARSQEVKKKGQPTSYKVSVKSDSIVDVEFTADKMINNLLVTVFDNKGELVFLDCQYNFSGPYKKSIAVQQPVKNGYYLKVTNDNEIFEKKLSTD
jgi:hypothetical protein